MGEIISRKDLPDLIKNIRKQGKTIVTTNGAFDILHVGHLKSLKFAKKYGDVLIVGKVLSSGNLEKGKKIVAWGASEKARERIKAGKGEFVLIVDEIKKNPELKGLEVVR